jgi:outer membrane protein OmpA-like peptidoglycan-associated protein
MAVACKAQRQTAATKQRFVAATIQRRAAAAPSSARTLQQRLGNQGTLAFGRAAADRIARQRRDVPGGEEHESAATPSPEGADCGTVCPRREPGELRHARGPMEVRGLSGSLSGLLVANFDVASASVKGDLARNADFAAFIASMVSTSNVHWLVRGHTDCRGAESMNATLRLGRARAVFNLLPRSVQTRITGVQGARSGECIRDNATAQGRLFNRSVAILIVRQEVTFTDEVITVPRPVAHVTFDGSTITARKGTLSASCPAITSPGEPIPPGRYCIRGQGEAQLPSHWYSVRPSRSTWFLLEPQFETRRFRMDIHPGSISEGCVTLSDRDCFSRIAAVLNQPGTTSGFGYDGYPPGNSAGVNNPRRTVTCVGWLEVVSGGGRR